MSGLPSATGQIQARDRPGLLGELAAALAAQASPWRPLGAVLDDALATIARRAIAHNVAAGNFREANAIRRTALRAGALL